MRCSIFSCFQPGLVLSHESSCSLRNSRSLRKALWPCSGVAKVMTQWGVHSSGRSWAGTECLPMKGSWARWWSWAAVSREGRAEQGGPAHVEQLLQRVEDLVGLDAAEDVDDLAVAGGGAGVDDVAQGEGLDGADGGAAGGQRLRPGVDDRLQLDLARVGLAHDVLGHAPLEQVGAASLEALERHGRGRQAVPQAGEVAGHGGRRWWWWCEVDSGQRTADSVQARRGEGGSKVRRRARGPTFPRRADVGRAGCPRAPTALGLPCSQSSAAQCSPACAAARTASLSALSPPCPCLCRAASTAPSCCTMAQPAQADHKERPWLLPHVQTPPPPLQPPL